MSLCLCVSVSLCLCVSVSLYLCTSVPLYLCVTRVLLGAGRYPWGAGFYDMSNDGDHCTDQFKLVAQLLKEEGYTTHALGKVRACTPYTRRTHLAIYVWLAGTFGLHS